MMCLYELFSMCFSNKPAVKSAIDKPTYYDKEGHKCSYCHGTVDSSDKRLSKSIPDIQPAKSDASLLGKRKKYAYNNHDDEHIDILLFNEHRFNEDLYDNMPSYNKRFRNSEGFTGDIDVQSLNVAYTNIPTCHDDDELSWQK